MNEQFSLHLDFQSFSCSPDCNVLGSACTDNSSFRCSPSAYLMQISWIFVCRASFRQVTASIDALQLLLLHAYYFCASIYQRTILLCPFQRTLIWRKIVAARTTYFIRYKDLPLRRQRGIQLLNGTKKRVWLRRDSDPSTLVLGKRRSIQLSYSANLERTNQLKIRSIIHRCELS